MAPLGMNESWLSRNTIKGHVAALAKNGRLTRHGAGRGAWYSLA